MHVSAFTFAPLNNQKNDSMTNLFDKSEYCPRCSGRVIKKPEMVFSIRFSAQSDYYVVRSNLVNEYSCLLAFLENKETASLGCEKY